MSTRIRNHIRSNIIGYVALFVALGGTAVALPGTNSVDSGDIINQQVKSIDIANEKVNTNDLQDNQVASSDVRDDTLTNGGLGALDLAPNSVGSSEVAVSRSSSGKSSCGIATLRPTPITAQRSSGRASTRTPATLRSSTQTSFGHFTWQRTGATPSAASQTATGTASGSSAG